MPFYQRGDVRIRHEEKLLTREFRPPPGVTKSGNPEPVSS